MRFVFATCSIAIVLAWLFLAFSHSSDLQTIKFQEKSGFSSPLISDTDDNLLWFLHVRKKKKKKKERKPQLNCLLNILFFS